MNQIWWNRIASTQFLLFYPINSATLFVSQTGNAKLGTVLFMIGGGILEQILLHDWYNSFYFSIVTWTTLGYGDFSPVENLRLVTAAEAFIGYIYMAILIGLLLNTSQKLNNKNKS